MAVGGKFSMELNFTRNVGKSRRTKIKSFWEFIDQQKELIPFRPSQASDESNRSTVPSNPSICQPGQGSEVCGGNHRCESLDPDYLADDLLKPSAKSESPTRRKGKKWYNELRILKDLGLDRVALAASNECKLCLREEENMVKDLRYADSVPQPYEELTAELKEFENRVERQKSKSVSYQTPGKYEHLVQ